MAAVRSHPNSTLTCAPAPPPPSARYFNRSPGCRRRSSAAAATAPNPLRPTEAAAAEYSLQPLCSSAFQQQQQLLPLVQPPAAHSLFPVSLLSALLFLSPDCAVRLLTQPAHSNDNDDVSGLCLREDVQQRRGQNTNGKYGSDNSSGRTRDARQAGQQVQAADAAGRSCVASRPAVAATQRRQQQGRANPAQCPAERQGRAANNADYRGERGRHRATIAVAA